MRTEVQDEAARIAAESEAIDSALDDYTLCAAKGTLAASALDELLGLVESWHRRVEGRAAKLTATQHVEAKAIAAHAIHHRHGGRYEHAGMTWVSDDGFYLKAEATEREQLG